MARACRSRAPNGRFGVNGPHTTGAILAAARNGPPVSELAIRRYEPDDADAVWNLHERALRDAGAYDEEYAHLDADLRDVERAFLESGGEFVVGERDGEVGASDASETSRRSGESEVFDLDSNGRSPRERPAGANREAGEIVAMGALQPAEEVDHHAGGASTGVVRRMRVDPAAQRRGYGTAVLERLEARARELGFERLVLDTTERQTPAMAFYEHHGYEEVRRESRPVVEMVFYEKSLA